MLRQKLPKRLLVQWIYDNCTSATFFGFTKHIILSLAFSVSYCFSFADMIKNQKPFNNICRLKPKQTFFFFTKAFGKVSKKVRKIPHFSGVGGFEKVIFRKKNMVLKCIKSPKYSFKSNLFFSYGGVWHLEYFRDPNSC